MSDPAENGNLPKAILYSWPTSVWSTVPQLCLYEKGYSSDEYIIKLVDISTIPTLVVPTLETTGNDVDTRYRSLRDTIPAPTLAPATIEALAVRDEAELKAKAVRPPGKSLDYRRQALQSYLGEAKQAVADSAVAPKEGSLTWEQKTVKFLEEKLKSNEQIWELYNGQASQDKKEQFFEVCRKTWTESLPDAFSRLESLFKGPFALGDQVSLADLHAISWLTRLVSIAGGSPNASGIDSLTPHLGGYKFGPKVRDFWNEWVQRESFQQVLVPVCDDFEKMSGK
ncbi:uncharacterized protein I303_108449 [Kwoniella dejecticola CBS 10117]|uniref:Glutathione S-transferase C-terminal domain-containing protein n=1 Tax=Kwoniella dejecticola CBS 10117 TaxID=1296121 RepID=A0AAJ8MLV1_9TREE